MEHAQSRWRSAHCKSLESEQNSRQKCNGYSAAPSPLSASGRLWAALGAESARNRDVFFGLEAALGFQSPRASSAHPDDDELGESAGGPESDLTAGSAPSSAPSSAPILRHPSALDEQGRLGRLAETRTVRRRGCVPPLRSALFRPVDDGVSPPLRVPACLPGCLAAPLQRRPSLPCTCTAAFPPTWTRSFRG